MNELMTMEGSAQEGVQIFYFGEAPVRVVMADGDPWFVAADVCEVLEIANSRRATNGLDDDEIRVHTVNTNRGPRSVQVINESGLYSMVLRSRKPEAKRFKKWVTSEVLPSIRKNGMYVVGQTPDMSEDELADLAIEYATKFKAERKRRLELEAENQVLAPKAEYMEKVLDNPNGLTATQVAKAFGFRSAVAFNKLLEREGIQFRRGTQWFPVAKYADKGYTMERSKVVEYPDDYREVIKFTAWTEPGKEFLYRFLQKKGYLKGSIVC